MQIAHSLQLRTQRLRQIDIKPKVYRAADWASRCTLFRWCWLFLKIQNSSADAVRLGLILSAGLRIVAIPRLGLILWRQSLAPETAPSRAEYGPINNRSCRGLFLTPSQTNLLVTGPCLDPARTLAQSIIPNFAKRDIRWINWRCATSQFWESILPAVAFNYQPTDIPPLAFSNTRKWTIRADFPAEDCPPT